MATTPCPTCGLPRAEDLIGEAACPVCGEIGPLPLANDLPDILDRDELEEAEPEDDRPWVIDERLRPAGAPPPSVASPSPNAPRGSRLAAGVLLGFLVGVPVGVGGVVGWEAYQNGALPDWFALPSPRETLTDTHAPSPTGPELAPPPREVVRVPPVAPPNPTPGTNEAPPPPEPAPPELAPPNPFRPGAPPAMVLDNPDGESRPVVRPGGKLVLRGKVKLLRVSGLEGGAVLDCSELEAEAVVVAGRIDGGSHLYVWSPAGSVTFTAPVVGGSTVRVAAPGGTVTFARSDRRRGDGGTIDGGATVAVKASTVAFRERIAGDGTRVAATLTNPARLSFAGVEGTARLEYAKADPDGPEPEVEEGRVTGLAKVTRVE